MEYFRIKCSLKLTVYRDVMPRSLVDIPTFQMNVLLPSPDINTARIFILTELSSNISNLTKGSFF
jgi:hypothetical protein